jgi:hypothetical protein
MGRDCETRFWETSVTTNHPEKVQWREHARSVRSVKRFDFVSAGLSEPGLTAKFLDHPLYSTDYSHGFGSIYTAVYRPRDGKVSYHWPDKTVEQGFGEFSPQSIEVQFEDGRQARTGAGYNDLSLDRGSKPVPPSIEVVS